MITGNSEPSNSQTSWHSSSTANHDPSPERRSSASHRRCDDQQCQSTDHVEGCARYSETDYLHFLDAADGSTRELEYQISLAARLGCLTESNESIRSCEETGRVIHGLIQSMRQSPRR